VREKTDRAIGHCIRQKRAIHNRCNNEIISIYWNEIRSY